jgi:hypothetical protein
VIFNSIIIIIIITITIITIIINIIINIIVIVIIGWEEAELPSVSKIRAYYLPLSDEVIFSSILPSFEMNGILSHQNHKNGNTLSPPVPISSENSMLSPHDILQALNTLSGVKYDDVRNDIVQGLLELLQVYMYLSIYVNNILCRINCILLSYIVSRMRR